jgi:HEAT repeat protein
VPALANALSDGDPDVRKSASNLLEHAVSNKKTRNAVLSVFVGALSDTDRGVRENAGIVLERIGQPAVPALSKLLNGKEPQLARKAADLLGAIGHASAVPALVKALGSRDTELRGKAEGSLGAILVNSDTVEALGEFEKGIKGAVRALRARYGISETRDVRMRLSRMEMECVRKRNLLAPDRGMLLDERPKPPQRGEVFREIRRALRHG